MPDFTRALYLGMRHPSHALRGWDAITTGTPAALETPSEHRRVAHALADLQGCQQGVLARSTLHLAWDLFGLWSPERVALYVDAATYPVLLWGVKRAAANGVAVKTFKHRDTGALEHLLRRDASTGHRPIVVADGWCPKCGRPAPLGPYLEHARLYGGRLVVDDTQALGILGKRGPLAGPYGQGGGGTLQWLGLTGPDIVVIASLAKAFGAPLAVIASSAGAICSFKAASQTAVHSSQPSAADVAAAERALALNVQHGDALRKRLHFLVARFRRGIKRIGLRPGGGLFPVQTIAESCATDLRSLQRQLKRNGLETLLLKADPSHSRQIVVMIRADHRTEDIDFAVDAFDSSRPRRRAERQPEIQSRYI